MRTTKSKKTAVVTPVSKPVTNEHGYLKRAFCLKILIATLFLLALLWMQMRMACIRTANVVTR